MVGLKNLSFKRNLGKIITALFIVTVLSLFHNEKINAAIPLPVNGPIVTDTTWTSDNIYVVTGTVTVNPGITLTIEAGTVIKFYAGNVAIDVNGLLDVNGTESGHVIFTAYNDDAAGGDTNGDGASASSAGYWRGIGVHNGATGNFDYAEVRYSGWYDFWDNRTPYGIYKTGTGDLTVNHSTISNIGNFGIWLNSASGTNLISNSNIKDTSAYGIYAGGTSPATISANTFENAGAGGIFPIGLSTLSSGANITADNVYTGAIAIEGGSMSANINWGNGTNAIYYLTGTVTVNPNQTLSIAPGTIIKSPNANVAIDVHGTLDVNGTESEHVIFTAYNDDAAGGDTNGDETDSTPSAGYWRGIGIHNGATGSFDYAEVRYSGWYDQYENPTTYGIYKTGAGDLTVTHSIIRNIRNFGIWLNSASGVNLISNSNIKDTSAYGIYAGETSPATISANTFENAGAGGIFPIGLSTLSSGASITADNVYSGAIAIEGGTITANTNWGNGSNAIYYLTGTVTVNPNQTLSIDPGTIIKSPNANVAIDVHGTLDVNGTESGHVIFTAYNDDAAGGDTNGNGASAPSAGYWRGIGVHNGANGNFDYAEVRYAGWYDYWDNRTPYGIYKNGPGDLTVSHSIIRNIGNFGIWLNGASGNCTIQSSTIHNNTGCGIYADNTGSNAMIRDNLIYQNSEGIHFNNSSPLISGNRIYENTNYGVFLAGAPTTPVLSGNRIYENPTGIYVTSDANPIVGGSFANANNIYGNTNYGLFTTTLTNINAVFNWWGDDSGPQNPSTNPSGGGNKVSDFINYGNWFGVPTWVMAPHISVSPPAYDFGILLSGETKTQTFTILNNGTINLNIGAINLIEQCTSAYNFISNNCSSKELAPFETCLMEVEFSPVSGGTSKADISIASDDPQSLTLLVSLTGMIELYPGDIDGDGSVTVADAIIALQILAGINMVDLCHLPAESGADVNNDNKTGIEEAIYILEDSASLVGPD